MTPNRLSRLTLSAAALLAFVACSSKSANTPDAGTPDSGTPDSGTPDAGAPDSGTPDGGPTAANWGELAAPVSGVFEPAAPYTAAELFAGPNKFNDGNYFHGVLPNGRIVKPAGKSVQIGMNPLGAALTGDGKFLITTNDDERNGGQASLQNATNVGGYSISVIDTSTMTVVSQISSGKVFLGLAVAGAGPYTLYASGGGDPNIKLFSVSTAGAITAGTPASITIAPIHPNNAGYVNNYVPAAAFNTADASGNKPPAPSGFNRTTNPATTFPAGLALSPDGKFLYVACNGDNSLAVIDTSSNTVIKQLPAGFFPYGVQVSADGTLVYVTNWGVTDYKFAKPTYDASGNLTALGTTGQNQPDGFYVPKTDTTTGAPKTSSVWVVSVPGANPATGTLSVQSTQFLGKTLDDRLQVGDTHPSAVALVGTGTSAALYVAKANDDAISIIAANGSSVKDFDLSLSSALGQYGDPAVKLRGAAPNALAVSPDQTRVYVAEAGLNSVAVLDTTTPSSPKLLGRIPTGWYPTGLAISADGKTLYIVNAKGVGEDLNPKVTPGTGGATGVESFNDSNFIFGTAQRVDVSTAPDATTALSYNYVKQTNLDVSVVPAGGKRSAKIAHVIMILHENKTFDAMLGNVPDFGAYASTGYFDATGTAKTDAQFTPVAINTQAIAKAFATAVNYYSDSEESDAGHQFAASGISSDYTQKTLLVKGGRGLLVNKNFEPEDYPASGYIFNNLLRNGLSYKNYGAMIRIEGTDTGGSAPTTLNDPPSGSAGFPANNTTTSPNNTGDTTTATAGLGQSYFLQLPVLAALGGKNANNEVHTDPSYPGYNFNISDQRRALEFIKDFDRMVAAGTVPDFLYIYQPNDHTGGTTAQPAALTPTAAQQVADGDVALGMVVQHIMKSPIYYDSAKNTGSAIFITYDDAQSSKDHIHQHRTPLMVVSPFARPAYQAKRHYSTASIVKTEELLLGVPPNNLGDLLATDLRDLFQPTYNNVTAASISFNQVASYKPSTAGRRIWKMVAKLDTSAPDRDSHRLGMLGRLSMAADELYRQASARRELGTANYRSRQRQLYAFARQVVEAPNTDKDD